MYVNFEIAAFFSSPYSRVKKRGNFKQPSDLRRVVLILF